MKRTLSAITIVAIGLLSVTLPSGVRAQSSLPQSAIDEWTHRFFYRVHKGLGRKTRSTDLAYIREWQAIQNRLKGNLVYGSASCGNDQEKFAWILNEYDGNIRKPSRLLDKVANAIFYNRHSNLNGRKI